MKLALTAAVLLSMNQAAFADAVGRSGGFDEDDITYGPPVVETKKNKVIPQPTSVPKPASKAEVASPVDIKPRMETAAASAPNWTSEPLYKMMPLKDGCAKPVPTEAAAKTPLKVVVNQESQTIKITVGEQEIDLKGENRVSTGGTLKIPDGSNNVNPYCAQTPAMHEVIPMADEKDFAGIPGCDAETTRANATIFEMYYSRTYGAKAPFPMPKAIRIRNGIFFHVVPPSYADGLGNDISGDCVRLSQKTATTLHNLMKKYKALDVTITPPRQHQPGETVTINGKTVKMYCDKRDELAAIEAKRSGSTTTMLAQSTGPEGVVGAPNGFNDAAADFIDPLGIWGLNKRGNVFTRGQNHNQSSASQPPRPKANVPKI